MNTCYYDHDELYCCVDLQKQLSVFRPKSPNVFTRTITNKRVAFVMNVRQPWAWALAKFYKDLENRMVAMCEDKILSLPFWVLICASAARVTRKDWLSLCTIMNTGHKHKHIHIPRIMDFRKGATNGLGLGGVIGAVKFDDTATTSKSKWHIKTYSHVYCVSEACCFDDICPIPITGFQGVFQNIYDKSFARNVSEKIKKYGFEIIKPDQVKLFD